MTQDEDQRKSIDSHLLWYCGAQAQGEFGWYELVFMRKPLDGVKTVKGTILLLSSVRRMGCLPAIDETQPTWASEEIDRDDPSEFIVRWIGWLVQAANGGFIDCLLFQRDRLLGNRGLE